MLRDRSQTQDRCWVTPFAPGRGVLSGEAGQMVGTRSGEEEDAEVVSDGDRASVWEEGQYWGRWWWWSRKTGKILKAMNLHT